MSLVVDIRKKLGSFTLQASFETRGGILGLLGASGCGKSMTLKCIAGIEKPDSGYIELDGTVLFDAKKSINLTPQQRRVGYLFQNNALFPNMTVRQNILCGLHRENNRSIREKRLQKVLQLLQLEGLEQHRPHQLSGGQAQRTALARILVNEPRLLMLDEPFSALDSHLREKLQLELRKLLMDYGHDVLMVTHSRDEAYHMCGQLAVMHNGRVLTQQDTRELFANPRSIHAAVLTGCKNIAHARKAGSYEVEVPEWGIRLHTQQPVENGLKAVGIRAHSFQPEEQQNTALVQWVGEMEEPFEWITEFRFVHQSAQTPAVWRRFSKNSSTEKYPDRLGVAPEHILLLYES
ncbi:MAG: ATP-binding cassette domain-containing protein [Clostridiales bacterium]|nr:ATP-binding cassette domain-containing protein [Clostridiales bacterium]